MTLLILSDSHGHPDHIREAIRRVRPDGILFAGDGLQDISDVDLPCPLWAVSGNCDWSPRMIVGGLSAEAEDEELITIEGIRILLMHGHRHSVKSGLLPAVYRAMEKEADILVFGHTHTPLCRQTESGMWVLNPGSARSTYGLVTIEGENMECKVLKMP